MTTYVWLFPLLFIFHDLEEIIGFIPWLEKKSDKKAKSYLFILKQQMYNRDLYNNE